MGPRKLSVLYSKISLNTCYNVRLNQRKRKRKNRKKRGGKGRNLKIK
jgi:hypothetical protein